MKNLLRALPMAVVLWVAYSGSCPAGAQLALGGGEGTAISQEGPFVVALSNAEISLVLDPAGPSQVRATHLVEGVDGVIKQGEIELVELILSQEAGIVTLERPPDSTERLVVEMTLGAARSLRLEGADVELVIEDRRPRPVGLPSPRQSLSSARLEVALANSSARLVGIRDALVTGDDSLFRLEATAGTVVLELLGGSAEVASHRGNLRLGGEAARFVLDDIVGSLVFDLRDGECVLRDSLVSAQGTLEAARLDVDGFEGALSLDATQGVVSVRRWVAGNLTLRGRGLIATVEGAQESLSARFRGGRLTLIDYSGEAKVQALQGARVESVGGGGELSLNLGEEATARVKTFAGLLKVEMTGASLEAEGIDKMAATATRSRIEVRRIGQLKRLEGVDAELVLDLTEVARVAPMKLLGQTRAWVALSSPCVVRTLAPESLAPDSLVAESLPGEAAEVSGCDLEVPDQTPRRFHAQRRFGGQATVLNVEVGADAVLKVEGH